MAQVRKGAVQDTPLCGSDGRSAKQLPGYPLSRSPQQLPFARLNLQPRPFVKMGLRPRNIRNTFACRFWLILVSMPFLVGFRSTPVHLASCGVSQLAARACGLYLEKKGFFRPPSSSFNTSGPIGGKHSPANGHLCSHWTLQSESSSGLTYLAHPYDQLCVAEARSFREPLVTSQGGKSIQAARERKKAFCRLQ